VAIGGYGGSKNLDLKVLWFVVLFVCCRGRWCDTVVVAILQFLCSVIAFFVFAADCLFLAPPPSLNFILIYKL
jgi:hypothetical protein